MSSIVTDYHKMQLCQPLAYACQFLDHELEIDGNIDKTEWQAVPFSSDFIDIEGARGAKPYFRTRMKMRWSCEYWYFCAELEERQVWAAITQKNSVIFHDNDFEIFIDPDGDNVNYYEFEVNALNTIWELNLMVPYKDRGTPINPYNISGLKSAVQIQGAINNPNLEDRSWTVEIAIPWQGLRSFHNKTAVVPQIGDYWRINFSRVQWDTEIVNSGDSAATLCKIPGRAEHNWVWSPQGVIDMHRPEKWGFAYFVAEQHGPSQTQREFRPPLPAMERLKDLAMELYYLERSHMDRDNQYQTAECLRADLSPAAQNALRELLVTKGHNSSGPAFIAKLQDEEGNTVLINQRSQLIF